MANIIERRSGIIIATCFIFFILTVSGISRYLRSTEIRVQGHAFANPESERLWNQIANHKRNMVPIRSLTTEVRADRGGKVCRYYRIEGPLVFVHVSLIDNRSEFLSPLEITVTQDDGHYIVDASQAVAIANAVAYLVELARPGSLFMGLSRQNLMRQSMRYFLLGEGEVGLMVYTILQHVWETRKDQSARPCIFLMSD